MPIKWKNEQKNTQKRQRKLERQQQQRDTFNLI